MADYTTVAKVGDIPNGSGASFAVNGRAVAVFNQNGKYFAIDDCCPHMGAPLSDGILENGTVLCPWHAWRFRIDDGAWCANPKIKLDQFDVRVKGDDIQVRAE